MALSPSAIKAAPPNTVLRDTEVPGLHVRTYANKSTYSLYYRTRAGTERRAKVGDTRSLSLTAAREIARGILAKVALGEDPSAAIAADRLAPTVAQMCEAYLADDLVKVKKSFYKDEWQVAKYVLPRWRARKAASITPDDFLALRKEMADTPIQFNRVLALCATMFNHARIPNPTEGVRRFPEKKRRRYMRPEEAYAIAAALQRRELTQPIGVAFVRLLILTGARPKEIAELRWDWLDGGVIHHPDAKTGARDIFLSPAAREIIDALPRVSDLVLGIKSPQKLWCAVREEVGCPDLRLYDLRHSFASVAVGLNMTLAQIGELLGHANTNTTARYAHLMDEHKRKYADATAAEITKRLEGPCDA